MHDRKCEQNKQFNIKNSQNMHDINIFPKVIKHDFQTCDMLLFTVSNSKQRHKVNKSQRPCSLLVTANKDVDK